MYQGQKYMRTDLKKSLQLAARAQAEAERLGLVVTAESFRDIVARLSELVKTRDEERSDAMLPIQLRQQENCH